MGSKDKTTVYEAKATDKNGSLREIINTTIIIIVMIMYALTFFVPKFYGATYPYVSLFVFAILVILLFVNVNPIKALKNKEFDIYLLGILLFITGINLIIVDSGKGAFFSVADFALIFYLSGKSILNDKQIKLISFMYLVLMVIWLLFVYPKLFADYTQYGYNTNTAATFTIYSMLCAFIFVEILHEKYEIAGLLMVIILLKGFQLSLWHRARGAFIMLILFMIFRFVIPKKWWANKVLYGLLCFFSTIGSLMFVMLYVYVGSKGVNFQMPFFYKNIFSGRDEIWYEFFSLFIKKPLTGIGTNVTIESFFEFNVHNAMYNYLVIHGLPVFIGILILIFIRLLKFRAQIVNNRVAMTAMCALMAVFFESFFDVDLIWADYALNLLFLLCCMGRIDENGKV